MAYLDRWSGCTYLPLHTLLQQAQPAPSYSKPNQHPPTARPTSTLLQHTQPTPSYSTPNQHPPTARPTSTLLQHTQPAPSYSTLNHHPPTAHSTSTLLQHTQPAPSYTAHRPTSTLAPIYSAFTAFATLYVPTLCTCHVSTPTLRKYVCACAPVPHVIVYVAVQSCGML